ncbi:MAG TPA: hypothetical protein VII94_04600 [Candidatus Saccharimonadales bacterium]
MQRHESKMWSEEKRAAYIATFWNEPRPTPRLILQQGDAVFYTGDRFKMDLTKDGKPLKGWIHAAVVNEPGSYVVEFPEAKNGDYIISVKHLNKARPPKTEHHDGPEIAPRRSRRHTEEK